MSRPSIISTLKPLPFDALEPLEFERMTLWLVEREGYRRARHLGLGGSEQGRDVVAYKATADGEELWYFQSKRYKQIDAATLKKEVDKYVELAASDPGKRPDGIVVVTNAVVTARVSDEVEKYARDRGLRVEFWAHTELDMHVKKHPDIVREFFHASDPPAPPSRARNQPPPLPEYFVTRRGESEKLKARLLSTGHPDGVLPITAVHGSPGIGKTTLVAAAIRTDAEVLSRFSDGVLWADLGREPNLSSLLTTWIQEMQDRSCLLILDDARDFEDVRPFLAGGSRCHVIVTTTRADVAEDAGAVLQELGPMTPQESELLLAAQLGRKLEASERREALAFASALGHLPLALVLGGARARKKRWSDLLEELGREIANLETLEGPRRRGRGEGDARLKAAFNLSLQDLRRFDERAWEAFAWLGATRENAVLTAPMMAVVWQVDESEAGDQLDLLWNDSLLLSSLPVLIGGREHQGYRLQALLHHFARTLLTDPRPQGLGIDLAAAHRTLLERYRQRTRASAWHTLPDDGYIHAHLSWHLEKAQQAAGLHAMLREETPEGRNGWYEACERLGQTESFLTAVRRALRLASEETAGQLKGRQPATALDLETRYALILSSLATLPLGIPPDLLGRLVAEEIWTPEQGLAYARRVPAETGALVPAAKRGAALISVARYLPDPLKWDLVESFRTDPDKESAADILASLGPHLSDSMLMEALDAVAEIEDPHIRLTSSARLAAHLAGPEAVDRVRQEIHRAVEGVGSIFARGYLLAIPAPYLREPLKTEVASEILACARAEEADRWLDGFLAFVQSWISSPSVLQGTKDLFYSWQWQYRGLIERGRVRLDPGEDVSWMSFDEFLTWFFAAPESELSFHRGRRRLAFFIAAGAFAPYVLNALAPRLSEDQFHRWYSGMLEPEAVPPALVRDSVLVQCLTWLPPRISGDPLTKALTRTQAIEEGALRLQALTLLLPQLSGAARDAAAAEAAALARGLEPPRERLSAYTKLAPHLTERDLEEAVRLAATIADPARAADVFFDVETGAAEFRRTFHIAAPKEEVLHDLQHHSMPGPTPALDALDELPRRDPDMLESQEPSGTETAELTDSDRAELDRIRASAIEKLGPHLTPSLLQELLAAAHRMPDSLARMQALGALLPLLPAPERRRGVAEASSTAASIDDPATRVQASTALAAFLDDEGWSEILKTLGAVPDSGRRVELLRGLVPHLPKTRLSEAAQLAASLGDAERQDEVLFAFAGTLEGGGRRSDLPRLVRRIQDPVLRARGLLVLARDLAPDERPAVLAEAAEAAREIEPAYYRLRGSGSIESRSTLLAEVARCADGPQREALLDEALSAELGLRDPSPGVLAEASLALAESGKVASAFETAMAIRERSWKWQALIDLAPFLSGVQLGEALDGFEEIDGDANRAILLGRLAGHLPESLVSRALDVFQKIEGPVKIMAAGGLADALAGPRKAELLDEALAILSQLSDEQSWVLGSTHVLRHLTESERARLLADGVAKSWAIADVRAGTEALIALSSWLSGDLLKETLDGALTISDPERRAQVVAALAVRAAEVGQPELALQHLAEIQGHARAHSLARIARFLSERTPLLRQALSLALRTEGDFIRQDQIFAAQGGSSIGATKWQARAIALNALAPQVTEELRAELCEAWRALVQELAGGKREDLLAHLALPSVAAVVGGSEAASGIAEAVHDVGRWWP